MPMRCRPRECIAGSGIRLAGLTTLWGQRVGHDVTKLDHLNGGLFNFVRLDLGGHQCALPIDDAVLNM